MPVTKTWHTTSAQARPEHSRLNDYTVPIDDVFPNGLKYPGDPSTGNARETAKCTCVMSIGGELDSVPGYSSPSIDARLQSGKLTLGEEIGTGINAPQWADVDGIQSVYKYAEAEEITADRFVQWFNQEYKVGVDIPRTVVREVDGEFAQLTCKAPGKSLVEASGGDPMDWFDEIIGENAGTSVLVQEQKNMLFLDELMGNADRNIGNILVNDEHLIGIDHGMAMSTQGGSDAAAAVRGIFGSSEFSAYLEYAESVSGESLLGLSSHQKGILQRVIREAESLLSQYGQFAAEVDAADAGATEQAIINLVERAEVMLEKGTL